MRGLLWVTVVLAVLWGGWWVVGSRGAKAAAEGWLDGRGRYETLTVAGFPNRFDVTVTGVELIDAASGIGWSAPFAQVFAMTWKPWHLIAALPGGQEISLPGGVVILDGKAMRGSLLLVPGADLALTEAVVEGADLTLSPSPGVVTGAAKLVASVRADDSRAQGYRLGASLQSLALAPEWAAVAGLPPLLDEVFFDANIALTAPIDRHMAASRPALTWLDLTAARVNWGALKLSAKGGFATDAAGFAEGKIDIRVENWRYLPPVLVASGVIGEGFAPALTRALEVMAGHGDAPDVLTLPLIAKAGRMSLGPFPLGPAPYWGVRSDG